MKTTTSHKSTAPDEQVVRILTTWSRGRRQSDERRRFPAAIRFGCLFICLLNLTHADARNWQPIADIAMTAEAFVLDKLARKDKRVTAQAAALDPRLKLARCEHALQAFLRQGAEIARRSIIGVRCSGANPWKIYVPVNVIVSENVLIARRSLPRGHALSRDDVAIEERDVSRLAGGYLSSVEELGGRHLKHQVMSGRVITPSMLAADIVVRRGQSVTLLVANSTLNITMSGKALTDGAIDERIRIENVKTGRVVEGIVRSPEHVEVLVY